MMNCTIVCIRDERGDHSFWILILLTMKQNRATSAAYKNIKKRQKKYVEKTNKGILLAVKLKGQEKKPNGFW